MEEVRFEDLPRIVSNLAMRIDELCGKINKVLPQVEISCEKWFSVDELREYLDKMDNENDGLFKYHLIDDKDMRTSIINTLEIDICIKRWQYTRYI